MGFSRWGNGTKAWAEGPGVKPYTLSEPLLSFMKTSQHSYSNTSFLFCGDQLWTLCIQDCALVQINDDWNCHCRKKKEVIGQARGVSCCLLMCSSCFKCVSLRALLQYLCFALRSVQILMRHKQVKQTMPVEVQQHCWLHRLLRQNYSVAKSLTRSWQGSQESFSGWDFGRQRLPHSELEEVGAKLIIPPFNQQRGNQEDPGHSQTPYSYWTSN